MLVPKPSRDYLNKQQLVDYRDHRRKLIQWGLNLGKNPKKAEGYAHSTVRQRVYRLDKFYRWIWEEEEAGYTLSVTTDHADAYMTHLAYQDDTTTYKANCQKAVKMLFRWQNFAKGMDIDWEPSINFSQNTGSSQPRDFLTKEERRKLREAALELGSIPHYYSVSPGERDKWKRYLAQRFSKPKDEIGVGDWERANSWKLPSLVWTTFDAGFRPVEVERATTSWVDLDNGLFRIPREDPSNEEKVEPISITDSIEMLFPLQVQIPLWEVKKILTPVKGKTS